MQAYEHARRATQGARHYQEDMAAVHVLAHTSATADARARLLVAVLADGMGGHAGGDVASRIVCQDFLAGFDATPFDMATPERLLSALGTCNAALADKVAAEPLLSGMGSTVIGALLGPDGIEWVSVGDSPLFLYRRGEVASLNADHSLAPELDRLASAGHMTRQAALSDPRRHMLRSALTGEEIEMIDLARQPVALYDGDYVILASDGVQTLDNEEIARVVAAYADAGPAAVADALIRAVEALRMPHQDNATVVVVRPVWS